MRKVSILIICALGFSPQSYASDNKHCVGLDAVLQGAQFSDLSKVEINEARNTALWSERKTLVSFCYSLSCFVVKPCEPEPLVIDASGVLDGNVGKVGWNPEYERIQNAPVFVSENWYEVLNWSPLNQNSKSDVDDADTYGVVFRTRLRIDGQRHTVYEPLHIDKDKVRYR